MDLNRKCKVNIQNGNMFISNKADNDGGAIIWTSNNFTSDFTNIFSFNKAFYANDIGSYPSSLKIDSFSNNDYWDPINIT